jgi:uncharacterized membrane protein YebE (DUF533 family)
MNVELKHSREFSSDKLYMWRTIIAIAHIDGHVCEDERAYLEGVLERMQSSAGIEADDYSILRRDLTNAQNALEMLAHVKDSRYRGQILYFAKLLAKKDGAICASEKALLDKLEEEIGKDIKLSDDQREELQVVLENKEAQPRFGLIERFERFLVLSGLKP